MAKCRKYPRKWNKNFYEMMTNRSKKVGKWEDLRVAESQNREHGREKMMTPGSPELEGTSYRTPPCLEHPHVKEHTAARASVELQN